MQAPSRRLGEFLVDRKVLSRDVLEHLLEREATEDIPLSKLLLSEGLVGEKDLVAAVAAQVGFRFVDFDQTPVNPTLDRIVPAEMAQRHLAVAVDLGGSDLHLTVGLHPCVRIHGDIKPLTEFPVMNGSEIRRMIYAVLTQKQREKFENELELDTSHAVPGVGRFRVNVFLQRDSVGSVMRVLPYEIKPLEDLGLPRHVKQFAYMPRGAPLLTRPLR